MFYRFRTQWPATPYIRSHVTVRIEKDSVRWGGWVKRWRLFFGNHSVDSSLAVISVYTNQYQLIWGVSGSLSIWKWCRCSQPPVEQANHSCNAILEDAGTTRNQTVVCRKLAWWQISSSSEDFYETIISILSPACFIIFLSYAPLEHHHPYPPSLSALLYYILWILRSRGIWH